MSMNWQPEGPDQSDDPLVTTAAPESRPSTRWLVGVTSFFVGVVVGVIVGTVGTAVLGSDDVAKASTEGDDADSATPTDTRLPDAVRSCRLDNSTDRPHATVSDGGMTLTFNHRGEDEYAGISITNVYCLLNQLDDPDSVMSHMNQTTSMDGRQTESWDGLTVAWSYHPDRGMDGVITVDAESVSEPSA